jgi:predicted nucleotidyltransferase
LPRRRTAWSSSSSRRTFNDVACWPAKLAPGRSSVVALERTALFRVAADEPMSRTLRRCALYTRKSSEEGLEQEFNSLHAQRESAEAYIASGDLPEAAQVYEELIALTRKTLGVEPMLRKALTPLAAKLETAFIYGSVAKGTDTAKSDIDLMLVGRNLLLSKVLELLVPLEAQLGRKISPTLLTPAEFKRRTAERDSFVNRVLSQPTLPLIGAAPGPGRAR